MGRQARSSGRSDPLSLRAEAGAPLSAHHMQSAHKHYSAYNRTALFRSLAGHGATPPPLLANRLPRDPSVFHVHRSLMEPADGAYFDSEHVARQRTGSRAFLIDWLSNILSAIATAGERGMDLRSSVKACHSSSPGGPGVMLIPALSRPTLMFSTGDCMLTGMLVGCVSWS